MTRKSGDEQLLDYGSLLQETETYYEGDAPVDEAELLNLHKIRVAARKHSPRGLEATIDLSFADDVFPGSTSPDDIASDQA